MALAQPMKTAQATPQKKWNRCGTTVNYATAQYTGAVATDTVMVQNTVDTDSAAATFAAASATPPSYVDEFPGGNYITHKFAMCVAGSANGETGVVSLAYREKDAGSNEVFAKCVMTISSSAIPFSTEDIAKYLTTSEAAIGNWYWVTDYTFSLNAAHGNISIAASIPPTFRYDFNGKNKLVQYPACVASFTDTNRTGSVLSILALWCDK